MDMNIIGDAIELAEMLDARDRRREMQEIILNSYKTPLISFTLNIVGPIKVFPLSVQAFNEGLRLIERKCSAEGIRLLKKWECRENTGYEAILAADAEALRLKRLMAGLEGQNSLGRIFDIDVIDTSGLKLSRSGVGLPERKCLLCFEPAPVCARSRAHSAEVLVEEERRIMAEYFINKHSKAVASLAARALLYEVSVTPKPGLVDRSNSGAHNDMDFFSFIDSALSLLPYFEELALTGSRRTDLSPKELFSLIRHIGKAAEVDMLQATGGVNTHKGAIFSMGIVSCALGRLYSSPDCYSREALASTCSKMTVKLMNDFSDSGSNPSGTAGEKLHQKHGATGIRGEAALGFPTALTLALPTLEGYLESGLLINDAAAKTLISIIASAEDTNIAARSSYERLLSLQSEIKNILASGTLENANYLEFIETMDRNFIAENISPGGSADIFSLALFIKFYEDSLKERNLNGF